MLHFSRLKAGLGIFINSLIHNHVTRTLLISSAISNTLTRSQQDSNTRFILIAS
jgi:hypothetical protein